MERAFAPGALRPMLERGERGKDSFVECLREQHGFTPAEGRSILNLYLKLRMAKVDHGVGAVNVKHGALLDSAVLFRALAEAKRQGL